MTLTKFERLVLSNQYRILAALCPDESAEHARNRQVVELGYEWEYRHLGEHILDATLSEDRCREVIDILTMFDDLKYFYGRLSDTAGIDTAFLEFPGFSCNTESAYLGYARFLLADTGRWQNLDRRADLDSHAPFLVVYRNMLAEYQRRSPPAELGRGDIARILAAANDQTA